MRPTSVKAPARPRPRSQPLTIRRGTAADAEALHALIGTHQAEGHLLPRSLDDIRRHAARFIVAETGGVLAACAELAPLSGSVAEVRSLVVARDARGKGLATRLVDELRRQAAAAGHETLAAFTHDPRLFVAQRFSIVPHQWVPEKIARDCVACPLFRQCGQHAMVLPLNQIREIVRHGVSRIEATEDRRVRVA